MFLLGLSHEKIHNNCIWKSTIIQQYNLQLLLQYVHLTHGISESQELEQIDPHNKYFL